ncbi:hypothetical protein AB0N06_13615 [Streptomyces sp. NPDC051020]
MSHAFTEQEYAPAPAKAPPSPYGTESTMAMPRLLNSFAGRGGRSR